MTMLFNELLDKLKNEDEITILELLNISSDELVDRFEDIVEQRQEYLRDKLEDEQDDEAVDW